ncbi:MAG: helix-turn-helix transcriptional regulator [Anaerolineales bacterium]|jgi:transcriptional regulator with XRE-family HTH domain
MPEPIFKSHEQVISDAMNDPAFKKAYLLLAPLHQVIREIVNLRHFRGLTQAELAKKTGTHQSRISKIETGEHDVQISTLSAIAYALDADIEIHMVPRLTEEFFNTVLEESALPETPIPIAIAQDTSRMEEVAFTVC